MIELLRAFQSLPRPIRIVTQLLVLSAVVFGVARAFKLPMKYTTYLIVGAIVIYLLVVGFNALLKMGEKRRAKSFEGNLGLHSREAGVGKEEIREALAELSEKWQQAVVQLREAGIAIYDLPWYLLIGEPQSGKSTTLKNSGLEFPVGADGLSGAGGTRNCDWWFSNEAVILDTAGRFTFQEENAPDQIEWTTFLKLLKKHRRYCPINGVIVVIPATSLVEDTPDEQERKAKNIRAKLLHLQKVLEIRFPVFILVTKADRILGFSEFFTKLDPVDQRQMFGWSNTEGIDRAWDAKSFEGIWDNIVQRVHKLRIKLLNDEPNLSQIDKMFVFPEELEAVKEPLFSYFHTIFAGSRYEEPFIFRGFYITSGIQQGRPIARACRDLLRVSVGDPQGVLEDLEQVFRKSRAYFIRDFYEKKAFQEQGLIARTRAALKRDKVNRLVLYGLGAVVIPILVFLLGFAAFNLTGRLRPVQNAVTEAKKCLAPGQTCSIKETWQLIDNLEVQKRQMAESRWLMRIMLRGGARNEITQDLLPAIQGALFKTNILQYALPSFDARAGRVNWTEHFADYDAFYGGLQAYLRFKEHRTGADPGRQKELRNALKVEHLLTFCRKAKGLDPSGKGKELDEWLASTVNPSEVDAIFKSMVAAKEAIASTAAPEPTGGLEAFKRYWTAETLAKLDPTYYFRTYTDLIAAINRLDPGAPGSGEPTAGSLAELGSKLARNFDDGARIMKGEGIGGRRPGRTQADWVDNCIADSRDLAGISRSLGGESWADSRCRAIPDEYRGRVGRREDYAHMFTEQPGTPPVLAWSDPATKYKSAWVDLGKLADVTERRTVTAKVTTTLSNLTGLRDRLDEAGNFYKQQQEKEVLTVAEAVVAFAATNPAAAFDADRGARQARDLGGLVLGLRTVPPMEDFFVNRVFGSDADFAAYYAKDAVPAASKFLNWGDRNFQTLRAVDELSRGMDAIARAEYDYLERAIRRSGGGGGSSEPTLSLAFPDRAMGSVAWGEFVREVRAWNPVVERGGGGGGAWGAGGGLTPADVDQFLVDNNRLRPLRALLGGGGSRRRTTSGPSEEAMRAAKAFQSCIRGLEEEALKAWRQLARDKTLLADFHSFSANTRLKGDPDADRLLSVERKGCDLLSKDIRPEFQDRVKELWRRVDRCCIDKFPFITERALRRKRDAYARGPIRGERGEVWSAVTLDGGRREAWSTITLETASQDSLDQLFYEDETLDKLVTDFALMPILAGDERLVDFIGSEKEKVRVMQRWQRFLFPDRDGGRDSSRKPEFTVRLIDKRPTGAVWIGERVGRVDLFGPNTIRPANPEGVTPAVPLIMDDRPLTVSATNEDRNGWTGRVELRGGPLKLIYFVLVASEGRPRQDDRVWTLRLEVPDLDRPEARPEGLFELSFDRPIPGVFPDLEGGA